MFLTKRWALVAFLLPASMMAQATIAPAPVPPALSASGKFQFEVIDSFKWWGLTVPLVAAGYTQALAIPEEWGGGMEGFGKRYANAFGTTMLRHTIEFGLENALHEDPRYFPSRDREKKKRIGHAIWGAVTTRTDAGNQRFGYSRVLSAVAAGQITNAWQPPSNNGVGDGFLRTLYTLGASAGVNVLQEFIPRLRPRELR